MSEFRKAFLNIKQCDEVKKATAEVTEMMAACAPVNAPRHRATNFRMISRIIDNNQNRTS